jgi:hypothetical protein
MHTELHSNTKWETLQDFKLPGRTVTLLSSHNLLRCGFDHDHYWADESQVFPCDSDMKLKQPVPICSAIFRLLLCGGVYQRSFAKTYLLAKCFTIICRVHELKRTNLKRTSQKVTRISMEVVCPDEVIQALHLTMRWGLLLCNSPVLKILPKTKNKLQYKQNTTLENQRQRNPFCPNQTKNQKAPTIACPETPIPNPNYTKVIHLGH